VKDPEHAQLLKAAFVDAPVFLLRGTAKHSGRRRSEDQPKRINGRASPHLEAARSPAGSPYLVSPSCTSPRKGARLLVTVLDQLLKPFEVTVWRRER
jgi:hypothetical protein